MSDDQPRSSGVLTAGAFASARLAMRPMAVADAEALHEGYRDPAVMRWWSSAPHVDIMETRAYLAPRKHEIYWREWTIITRHDSRVIGTLAANNRRAGVAEIGYLLIRENWGQGYAREAVARLIDLLIVEEGHRRVMADTDPDNVASIRLLESLGFRREGLLREEWETHIGVRDSLLLGLLAPEWHAVRGQILSDR